MQSVNSCFKYIIILDLPPIISADLHMNYRAVNSHHFNPQARSIKRKWNEYKCFISLLFFSCIRWENCTGFLALILYTVRNAMQYTWFTHAHQTYVVEPRSLCVRISFSQIGNFFSLRFCLHWFWTPSKSCEKMRIEKLVLRRKYMQRKPHSLRQNENSHFFFFLSFNQSS